MVALCGVPFSGKSTLARRLATDSGWTWLETDAIAAALFPRANGGRLGRAEWAAVYRASFGELESCLERGQSVVYGATNFRRLMRDRLRQIAAPFAAPVVVVVVDPPLAEVERRRRANRACRLRRDVASADFGQVVSRFQWPSEDETVLRYEPAVPFAEWRDRLNSLLVEASVPMASRPIDLAR